MTQFAWSSLVYMIAEWENDFAAKYFQYCYKDLGSIFDILLPMDETVNGASYNSWVS